MATAVTAGGCGSSNDTSSTSSAPTKLIKPADARETVPATIVRQKGTVGALVRVQIKGRPFIFKVDTGATRTVVDQRAAKALHLPARGPAQKVTTLGCTTMAQPVAISDWRIGSVQLPPVTVSSTKTEVPGGTEKGARFGGLLGADVLSMFKAVTVEYRGSKLRLGATPMVGGKMMRVIISRAKGETAILAKARVHGRPTAFIFDTGAGQTTIDSRAAKPLGLKSAGKAKTIGAVTCTTQVKPVRLDRWSAGGVTLPTTTALSSRSALTAKVKGKIIGLIGADVMSTYGSVTVDFAHSRVQLGGATG